MELVTGKVLAADLGVTGMAVTLARQKGRISFADAERRLYDRAGARAQWEQNRERIHAMPAASPTAGTLMLGARLRRELAEAALAERKLQEAEGELCRVAEVRRAASDARRRLGTRAWRHGDPPQSPESPAGRMPKSSAFSTPGSGIAGRKLSPTASGCGVSISPMDDALEVDQTTALLLVRRLADRLAEIDVILQAELAVSP